MRLWLLKYLYLCICFLMTAVIWNRINIGIRSLRQFSYWLWTMVNFRLVNNQKENCPNDIIAFNLSEIRIYYSECICVFYNITFDILKHIYIHINNTPNTSDLLVYNRECSTNTESSCSRNQSHPNIQEIFFIKFNPFQFHLLQRMHLNI